MTDLRARLVAYLVEAEVNSPTTGPSAILASCDLTYSRHLLGLPAFETIEDLHRHLDLLTRFRLAGASAGNQPALSVHLTAYALASLTLADDAHRDDVAAFVRGIAWDWRQLLDPDSLVPRWPGRYSHHAWRVGHWIGGAPAILRLLWLIAPDVCARHAMPQVVQVLEACDSLIDRRTGLLRTWRSPLLQTIFRQIYRLRHDPNAGDIGGIAHLHWINHAEGRAPYKAADALHQRARTLMQRRPFIERAPYCLDFDVVQIVRTSATRPLDEAVKQRAGDYAADIVAFLRADAGPNYSLHKLPGALATLHECALILGVGPRHAGHRHRPGRRVALTMASTKPRKIIGVISFMNAAGAQEALLRLARQMRTRGHQMEVWFLYREADTHADEPFVRVFEPRPRLSPIQYAEVFIRLCRALAAARPDAVVGFLPLGNVFGLTAAAIAGVPRRVASQRAPGQTFGRLMRAFDRLVGSSHVYDRIICVSDAVRASFADYPAAYRTKLSVIHNGIEWHTASETPAEARRVLGLPPDAFLYVAIGRMKSQKNYGFLIETFAGVSDGLLVIAGDGPLRPQLEAQARASGVIDRIYFLGALDQMEVRRLLRAADVFVQPSFYEGQSNAVLEAMHAALPIIVSDIPEQRETVLDPDMGEVGGMVMPLGDMTAWTNALNDLRTDPKRRASLSAAARAIVERRFALSRMIDGFEAELCLSSPRASAATTRQSAAAPR